jgi:hypothetical protein
LLLTDPNIRQYVFSTTGGITCSSSCNVHKPSVQVFSFRSTDVIFHTQAQCNSFITATYPICRLKPENTTDATCAII